MIKYDKYIRVKRMRHIPILDKTLSLNNQRSSRPLIQRLVSYREEQ